MACTPGGQGDAQSFALGEAAGRPEHLQRWWCLSESAPCGNESIPCPSGTVYFPEPACLRKGTGASCPWPPESPQYSFCRSAGKSSGCGLVGVCQGDPAPSNRSQGRELTRLLGSVVLRGEWGCGEPCRDADGVLTLGYQLPWAQLILCGPRCVVTMCLSHALLHPGHCCGHGPLH